MAKSKKDHVQTICVFFVIALALYLYLKPDISELLDSIMSTAVIFLLYCIVDWFVTKKWR